MDPRRRAVDLAVRGGEDHDRRLGIAEERDGIERKVEPPGDYAGQRIGAQAVAHPLRPVSRAPYQPAIALDASRAGADQDGVGTGPELMEELAVGPVWSGTALERRAAMNLTGGIRSTEAGERTRPRNFLLVLDKYC